MIEAALIGKTNSANPPSPGSPARRNVLLACCDKAVTRHLNKYLSDTYHLLTATNERQLFSVLERNPIDLILINWWPGDACVGMQTCSRLKSKPAFAHLPVILIIPANNQETRIGCLRSGADAWMEIPVHQDHLRAQIRNLLDNRRRVYDHHSRSLPFGPHPVTGIREESAFLGKLNSFIIDHLSDPCLRVEGLARQMNISLPTLYRKIKSVSDTTPNEMINTLRLNRAAELLTFGGYKVFQIFRMVGFHSRSNFGKAFVKQFGLTPREYQQMAGS